MKKGSKCLMSMFDSNDFLKLIQEGKISPDTITKDFTEALNAALAAKKQADEAAAKKKAEEDFNVATFLYEDAKKNLDQVISVFDNLEKLSSENERAYENHLREVCVAEEMFREIEKEIQAFEKKITQDFEEMTNIRKILISFGS